MKKYIERLWNGLIKENPVLVLMLGMCPALAVSTQASNGIGMGLSTLAVLVLSNFVISCLRKVIPDQVRLPQGDPGPGPAACLHCDRRQPGDGDGTADRSLYSQPV